MIMLKIECTQNPLHCKFVAKAVFEGSIVVDSHGIELRDPGVKPEVVGEVVPYECYECAAPVKIRRG